MSRAVHLSATVAEIEKLCGTHSFRISVIEPLLSGGSRVVLLDGRDADQLRIIMKGKIIAGDIKRSPAHVSRQPPPSYRSR